MYSQDSLGPHFETDRMDYQPFIHPSIVDPTATRGATAVGATYSMEGKVAEIQMPGAAPFFIPSCPWD